MQGSCKSLLVSLVLLCCPIQAASLLKTSEYQVERIAQGLAVPWGLAPLSDTQLLVTERRGRLLRLNLVSGERQLIEGLPQIAAYGQGGLLDIALAPDFAESAYLYLTYSKLQGSAYETTLARARLQGNQLLDWQDLLITRSGSDSGQHFGSRISFDEHGHVFFGVGDRGKRTNGQNLATHAGSILRLRLDGSVPEDNPFVGQAQVWPHIFSYGNRNPQGLVFDTKRGILWEIEHGPRGGDELNRITAGANYGWPRASYGKEYWGPLDVGEAEELPGMMSPVKVYTPSIAPGSLLLYTGALFPQWQGDLFAGALKLRHLNHIQLNAAGEPVGERRLLSELDRRIRALAQTPDGAILLSTDRGEILRLTPPAKP